MKNWLNLPVLQKERILIKVSGTEDAHVKNVDIVSLKITSPTKTIVTDAICTPIISSNVLNQDVKTDSLNYEHSKRLELADSSPETTWHGLLLFLQ